MPILYLYLCPIPHADINSLSFPAYLQHTGTEKRPQFSKPKPSPAKSVLCSREINSHLPRKPHRAVDVHPGVTQLQRVSSASTVLEMGHHLLTPWCRAQPLPSTNPTWACYCQGHWPCPVLSNYPLRGRKHSKCDLCSPRAAVTHSGSLVTLGQDPMKVTQGNHSPNSREKPQAAKGTLVLEENQHLLCTPGPADTWQNQGMVLFSKQERGRLGA